MTPQEQQQLDPGTGSVYKKPTQRLFNGNGTFNVKKIGGRGGTSTYQLLINIPWFYFLCVIFLFLAFENAVFAAIYVLVGVSKFNIEAQTLGQKYLEAFYFSVQTFTTVGYGGLMPLGNLPNIIASIEMLIGIISVAIVTGVTYGKFSRPRANMVFSKNALIAPYHGKQSIQFRFANLRRSQLLEVKAKVILSWEEKIGKKYHRQYQDLQLERNDIMFFPMSWTIVHEINESSPLQDWRKEDYLDKHLELLILVSGYDDTFHQTVYQTHSYTSKELIWNAKFHKPFYVDENSQIVFDLRKIHRYDEVKTKV